MLEYLHGDHGVEGVVGERELVCIPSSVRGRMGTDVQPDLPHAAAARRVPAATAQIQDAALQARQTCFDE